MYWFVEPMTNFHNSIPHSVLSLNTYSCSKGRATVSPLTWALCINVQRQGSNRQRMLSTSLDIFTNLSSKETGSCLCKRDKKFIQAAEYIALFSPPLPRKKIPVSINQKAFRFPQKTHIITYKRIQGRQHMLSHTEQHNKLAAFCRFSMSLAAAGGGGSCEIFWMLISTWVKLLVKKSFYQLLLEQNTR